MPFLQAPTAPASASASTSASASPATAAPKKASVAIVGSGICGLFTGLALAKNGFNVTLFERDTPPPEDSTEDAFFVWPRRGAAQFRHPHAFLGLMCNVLEENYPDLLEDFFAAGARKVAFVDTLSEELKAQYQPLPDDAKIWTLMCRRATLETVLRRYVKAHSEVTIRNEVYVSDLLIEHNDQNEQLATGLELTHRGEQNQITQHSADIVIDASGRSSKFNRWIKAHGANVVEERHDAEIVYYTRHYKLLPGIEEPPRNPSLPASGDLGFMKYGIFPGDSGHFALIICLPNEEHALREAIKDGDQFDSICMQIPGLRPWISRKQAEPTTKPFGIGQIHAVWRDYVNVDAPKLLNFFAVGDAAIRTNPLYGRGCSTGTLHAHLLAEVLAGEQDPWLRAEKFKILSHERIRPIYDASLEEDKRGIRRAANVRSGLGLHQAKSWKHWLALAFGDALTAAARHNLAVHRGIMRTINLVEKPGDFLRDSKIRRTILAYMLRGRKRNAQARPNLGVTRDSLLAHIQHISEADADQQAPEPVARSSAA